jgi:hypothetical protein
MPDRAIYLEDVTQLAGDGMTDDAAALQAVLNSASHGDVVKAKRGATYWLAGVAALPNRSLTVPSGITIDPNGATFAFAFNQASTYGFRLLDFAAVWGRGTVKTAMSQNGLVQAIDHAPFGIGALYGDDGPINTLNPYLSARGWKIGGGLSIETVKPDGSLVQIFGAPEDWLIEDVYFPDSAFMGLGIGADWLPRGAITSIDSQMAANLSNFQNGLGCTLHPGYGNIRRIHAGVMTNTNHVRGDGGPTVIRLSGCHDVKVADVHARKAAAVYRNVGGDLGFEFAPDAIKLRAHKGNRAERLVLRSHTGTNPAVFIDTNADNVGRAKLNYGYQPLLPSIASTDIVVRDASVAREAAANPQRAFWVVNTIGARLEECSSIGALFGVHVDGAADDISVTGGTHEMASGQSVLVDGTDKPERTLVSGVRCLRSGQGGSNVGAIELGRSINPVVKGNKVGTPGDALEKAGWGIRATDDCDGYVISENQVLQVRPSTNWPAISCGVGESINKGRVVNNFVAPGLTPYGGASTVLASTYKTMQKVNGTWVVS